MRPLRKYFKRHDTVAVACIMDYKYANETELKTIIMVTESTNQKPTST